MTKTMTRANRIAVSTTENGYVAKYYRTHKHLTTIASADTTWVADEDANATTNRESFRQWVCDHAEEFGILWDANKAEQAWERKHNTYQTDEQVAEDAITLITPVIARLADKCRYDMTIDSIEVTAVTAKDSTLTYVENGRYIKSGAWCVADIEVTIMVDIAGTKAEILHDMEIKSGQICKPKTTIAQWNEMVAIQLDLQGIVLDTEEDKEVA